MSVHVCSRSGASRMRRLGSVVSLLALALFGVCGAPFGGAERALGQVSAGSGDYRIEIKTCSLSEAGNRDYAATANPITLSLHARRPIGSYWWNVSQAITLPGFGRTMGGWDKLAFAWPLSPHEAKDLVGLRIDKHGSDTWCLSEVRLYFRTALLFSWKSTETQSYSTFEPPHPRTGAVWLRNAEDRPFLRFINLSAKHNTLLREPGTGGLSLKTCAAAEAGTRDTVSLELVHDGMSETILVPLGALDGAGETYRVTLEQLEPLERITAVVVRTSGSDALCLDWMALDDGRLVVLSSPRLGSPLDNVWVEHADRTITSSAPATYNPSYASFCPSSEECATVRAGYRFFVDATALGCIGRTDDNCNGLDEDCDGVVDDDFVGAARTCGTGVCLRSSRDACQAGHVVDTCRAGAPTEPVHASCPNGDCVCDGLDGDCDGRADDGYVSVATSCGKGICSSTGMSSCVNGSVQSNCAENPSGTELCDTLDNDCDGVTNENLSRSTSCGYGPCRVTVSQTCNPSGAWVGTCTPNSEKAVKEVRGNRVDDDCDGQLDEVEPGDACARDADCQGLMCVDGQCRDPHCTNGVQDLGETKVDCGGGGCEACGPEQCAERCRPDERAPPPAQATLRFSSGAFTRASEASYESEPGRVEYAPSNTLRWVDVGGVRMALFEGPGENLALRSADLSVEPWYGIWSARRPTPNEGLGPDGTKTADLVDADNAFYQPVNSGEASRFNFSLFARAVPGSEPIVGARAPLFLLTDRNGELVGGREVLPVFETFERVDQAVTSVAPNTTLYPLVAHAGGFPDESVSETLTDPYLIWGAQVEAQAFPTSYIATSDRTATRAADRMEFKTIPFWIRQSMFQFDVAPLYASDEMNPGQRYTLLSFGNNTDVALVGDGDRARLQVRENSALRVDHILRFARHQVLRLTIHASQGQLILSGSDHEDAEIAASFSFPNTSMSVGSRLGGGEEAFAAISELRLVSAAETACVPDASCSCGDGLVSFGEGCDSGANARCDLECKSAELTVCGVDQDCPFGQVCGRGAGVFFGLGSTAGVCWPAFCASEQAAHCGGPDAACGACLCTPSCDQKRCGDDPSDGCGGRCRGLCAGSPGCSSDADCGVAERCDPNGGEWFGAAGPRCVPTACAWLRDDSSTCGHPGALCGPVCPPKACTPRCDDRNCGDDGCGGSCGQCAAGQSCVGGGYCEADEPEPTIEGHAPIQKGAVTDASTDDDPTFWIEGSFAVDDGQARYRVPIELPAGRVGMEPSLALSYAAGVGSNPVGTGWQIDGVSQFHRCPSSSGASTSRVRMRLDDPLCFSGKRLKLVGELPEAGDARAEYRAEGMPHARILAHDIDEQGPAYFTLEDGTGRTLFFGTTFDSSDFNAADYVADAEKSGQKLAWGLAREQDLFGNYVTYRYDTENEENLAEREPGVFVSVIDTRARYLQSVSYTGIKCRAGASRDCKDLAPNRQVTFEYEQVPFRDLSDVPIIPRTGPLRSLRKLVVKQRKEVVREYWLEHDQVQGRNVLDTLRLCVPAPSGVRCASPTKFSYGDDNDPALFAGEAKLGSLAPPNPLPSSKDRDPSRWAWAYTIDADGDGVSDVLHRKKLLNKVQWGDEWELKLTRRRENGELYAEAHSVSLGIVQTGQAARGSDLAVRDHIVPVDVNKDGKTDLIVHQWEKLAENDWRMRNVVFLSTGKGFKKTQTLEVDGGELHVLANRGGAPDLAICSNETSLVSFFRNRAGLLELERAVPLGSAKCDYAFVVDYGQDQRQDLLILKVDDHRQMQWHVLERDGRFTPTGIVSSDLGDQERGAAASPLAFDFDGDGHQDVLLLDVAGTCSFEDLFVDEKRPSRCGNRLDAVIWRSTPLGFDAHLTVSLEGTGLPVIDSYAATTFTASRRVADFDGDGRDDLLIPKDKEYMRPADPRGGPQQQTEWLVFLSRPNGFEWATTGATVAGYKDYFQEWGPLANGLGDFNGDGAVDLLYVQGIKAPSLAVRFGRLSKQRPALLRRVEEGNGRLIRVNYVDDPMSGDYARSENVYRPAEDCPAHATCLRRPPRGTVARTLEGFVAAPDGPARVVSYRYADARVGPEGWLGYGAISSDLHASDQGLVYRQTLFWDRAWDPEAGRHLGVELPAKVERIYPLDNRIGAVSGSSLARLVSSTYERRQHRAPVPFESAKLATHTVFEAYPTADPFAGDGLSSAEAMFKKGALSVRTEEFAPPDSYGNPGKRETVLYALDDNGNRVPVVREEVTPTHDVTDLDRGQWTVMSPHQVKWVHSAIKGSDVHTAITERSHERGMLSKVVEKTWAGVDRLTTTIERDDYGNPTTVTETDPLQELPRTREIKYRPSKLFPIRVIQTARSPTKSGTTTLTVELDIDEATGLTLVSKDPAGLISKRAYDGFGRPVWESRPDGTSTRTRYALAQAEDPGQVRVVVESGLASSVGAKPVQGQEQELLMDGWGRVVASRQRGYFGAWVQVDSSVDVLGRTTARSSPHQPGSDPDFWVRWEHDALGRVVEEQNERGIRHYGYVARSVLSSELRAKLAELRGHASWQNQLTAWVNVSEDERDALELSFLDARGAQIAALNAENARTLYVPAVEPGLFRHIIDDGDNVTTMVHDDYGKLLRVDDPNTGEKAFSYYGTGELYEETTNGETTTYAYDSIGRLVRRSHPGELSTWDWDTGGLDGDSFYGRLMATSADGVSTTYRYDGVGRLQTTRHAIRGKTYDTTLAYDRYGRLSNIYYPDAAGDFAVHHDYDDYGHLTKVSRLLTEVGAIALGDGRLWEVTSAFEGYLPAKTEWGDGIRETWTYGPANHRLQAIERRDSTGVVDSFAYTYASTGNLQTKTRNGLGETYIYDRIGRLKEVRVGADFNVRPVMWSADYSGTGNIDQRLDHGIYHYEHEDGFGGPHAIATTDSGYSFLYDALGRVRQRTDPDGNTSHIEYTSFDLPRSISREGDETAETTFGYDADQSRAWRQQGDELTRYAGLFRETTAGDTTLAEYTVYAGGEEIARVSRRNGFEDTTYMHRERLGSVALARSLSGETQQFSYDPFGKPTESRNAFFAGHEVESDDELIDMKGRYYDAAVGRFLTPDPLVQAPHLAESLNRYSYVWNNPLNLVDPTGFQTRPDLKPSPEDDGGQGEGAGGGALDGFGEYARSFVPERETATANPSSASSQARSKMLADALDYIDRNQLVLINRVGEAVTGWGEAVSFGAGNWLQEELGLGDVINESSTAYQVGLWGSVVSPGGWRALLTNPRAVAIATIAGGKNAIALGANAYRATASAAASGASGVKTLVLHAVDTLPVPGLGVGGGGGVTIGSLRAGARGAGELIPAGRGAAARASATGAGVAGCFAPGTIVHLEDGPKAIEEVQAGDRVWAQEEQTGEIALRLVVRTFVRPDQPVIEVILNHEGRPETILATVEHPFWTQRGWVGARQLSDDDRVLQLSGAWSRVTGVRETAERVTVYNFEVEGFHTYFVGEQALLVHNNSWATLFKNQLPGRLATEIAAAARVGAGPIRMGTQAAEAAMNSGTIKWVVTEGGELLISPHTVAGVEISHAVLSGGRGVLAAGQAEIAAAGGRFVGMEIVPHSGHFMPSLESLQIGIQAFAKHGIGF